MRPSARGAGRVAKHGPMSDWGVSETWCGSYDAPFALGRTSTRTWASRSSFPPTPPVLLGASFARRPSLG